MVTTATSPAAALPSCTCWSPPAVLLSSPAAAAGASAAPAAASLACSPAAARGLSTQGGSSWALQGITRSSMLSLRCCQDNTCNAEMTAGDGERAISVVGATVVCMPIIMLLGETAQPSTRGAQQQRTSRYKLAGAHAHPHTQKHPAAVAPPA
jgi:hypothetical protein